MKIEEVNDSLRSMINEKIDQGWQKTKIGKVLLGANGQAHLNHFLKVEKDGSIHNVGVKPLQKIASTIDFDVMVVFVQKDNQEASKYIQEANMFFVSELSEALQNYLSGNTPIPQNTNKTKKSIDVVLDQMFDIFED